MFHRAVHDLSITRGLRREVEKRQKLPASAALSLSIVTFSRANWKPVCLKHLTVTILQLVFLIGCGNPTSHDVIMQNYIAAECVPLSVHPRIYPPTREWDYIMRLRTGSKVHIKGAQAPVGRIDISYDSEERSSIAADPGDYIYPADLRVDRQNERLYVKAHGPAGGFSIETWLFEFDLNTRVILKRIKVKNGVLTAECEESAVRP